MWIEENPPLLTLSKPLNHYEKVSLCFPLYPQKLVYRADQKELAILGASYIKILSRLVVVFPQSLTEIARETMLGKRGNDAMNCVREGAITQVKIGYDGSIQRKIY